MKILANDGLGSQGIEILTKAGHEVLEVKVAQEQIGNYLNSNNIEVLLVRSATKVTAEIIDQNPKLKVIGRGGVGLDNIDVAHATAKGIHIVNTPLAATNSVAELVIAHLLTGVRYLQDANRNMPLEGDTSFLQLKKTYSEGTEIAGKLLGIIGFGNIGKSVAKKALGLGMKVQYYDPLCNDNSIEIEFYNGQSITLPINSVNFDELIASSDFITLHTPSHSEYLLGENEFGKMKDGVAIINTARGGLIDEVALIQALDDKKVAFAGLDVFENEPRPEIQILMHPQLSLSPHIGASTSEGQERVSIELAEKIVTILSQ